MILSFNIEEVKKLVDCLENSKKFNPIYTDLYDAQLMEKCLKDGVNKRNKNELPYEYEEIDTNKVQPSFTLVKDHGVYLVCNSKSNKTPSESGLISYAKGFNPDVDEDWWDNSYYELGGDDFALSIPLSWYKLLITKKPNARAFRINLGKKQISVVI